MKIQVRHVGLKPCWRIIPTRYPEERLFDRVTEPEDREAIEQLEQMTNERVRQERGEISIVPPGDRVKGPGSAYIMSPFCHPNPEGSRFSNGSYGVYYAARSLDTAVAETRFHREEFLRRTKERPMRFDMRVLTAMLDGDLHDVRGMKKKLPKVYARKDYDASQALGAKLRKDKSYGIAYDSVRHKGGECVAIFRPPVLSVCRSERNLLYEWDGKRIVKIFELQEYMKE